MKRRDERKRTKTEQCMDNARHHNAVERDALKQPRYKSIFTERPHYGIPDPKKGVTT